MKTENTNDTRSKKKSIKKSNSGVVNKVTCLMSKASAPAKYQKNEKPIKKIN
jgi:hypothetical protein